MARVAYYSFNVITGDASNSNYQSPVNTFFSELTTELFYLNYAKSFYVYTLSSQYFRRIFVERIIKIFHRFYPHRMNNVMVHHSNLHEHPVIEMRTMHVQTAVNKL